MDVCPDRFRILLDWFRYEELFVPTTVPMEAVLRDAARAVLGQDYCMDQSSHSRSSAAAGEVSSSLRRFS